MAIKVNIASMFRDSQIWGGRLISQVPRFFNQITTQELLIRNKEIEIGKIICVYTESKDNTLEKLEQEKNKGRFNIEIIEHGSNYNTVKSSASAERITELSSCGNIGLENSKNDCDFIFWVESDIIIYDNFLLLKLLRAFDKIDKLGIISPIILLDTNNTYFYDTYVFRSLDGSQWRNKWIWSDDFNDHNQYIPMNSVGSCGLIKADLIREGCSFKNGAFINLCKEVKLKEFGVYCDKRTFIYHPSSILLSQRWV